MRHVFDTMGTVASIDLPASHVGHLDAIEALFQVADERFSLYRSDSELSRIATDELTLAHASVALRASYERAIEWRIATDGLFTPLRPDGVLDLNGIVKAQAIEAAGAVLDSTGCPFWSINVGGDILVRDKGGPWVTGIVDPGDSTAILLSLDLGGPRRALATSGSVERGDHIWRGGSWAPSEFVQVSVAAADIVTADVLATAIVAGGRAALDNATDRWPIDVLAVGCDGSLLATPGMRAAGAAPQTARAN